MRTLIHHAKASLDRDGNFGSRVEIHMHAESPDEWSGIYHFGSHGMTVADFHDRVSELKAYHHAKMKRLNGFKELRMRDIVVDGVTHRIVDATLLERGPDVELKLGVYLIGALGHQVLAFRKSLVYPSIEAVPDDDSIVRIARARIEQLVYGIASHEAFIKQVAGAVI